jgi:hypothetical protein
MAQPIPSVKTATTGFRENFATVPRLPESIDIRPFQAAADDPQAPKGYADLIASLQRLNEDLQNSRASQKENEYRLNDYLRSTDPARAVQSWTTFRTELVDQYAHTTNSYEAAHATLERIRPSDSGLQGLKKRLDQDGTAMAMAAAFVNERNKNGTQFERPIPPNIPPPEPARFSVDSYRPHPFSPRPRKSSEVTSWDIRPGDSLDEDRLVRDALGTLRFETAQAPQAPQTAGRMFLSRQMREEFAGTMKALPPWVGWNANHAVEFQEKTRAKPSRKDTGGSGS